MRPTYELYLHGPRGARTIVVPGRVAAWIFREFGAEMHRRNRGDDPELEAVFVAFGLASREGSDPGTKPAPRSELAAVSTQDEVRPSHIADQLNMTTRAVTKACAAGRLAGRQDDEGRWWIEPAAAARFIAQRKDAA